MQEDEIIDVTYLVQKRQASWQNLVDYKKQDILIKYYKRINLPYIGKRIVFYGLLESEKNRKFWNMGSFGYNKSQCILIKYKQKR